MANKFWIGGTGNFSDDTHWSTSTGGTNNTTHAGSADVINMDASSGGGTITIDIDITAQGWIWGLFTGTVDNSANHNVTTTVSGNSFNGSGGGARTFTGGSGTYTLSAANATWSMTTTTGLTNPATAFSSATVIMSGVATTGNSFLGGGMTYGAVQLNGNKSVLITGANTFTSLAVAAPNTLTLVQSTTQTITGTFTWTGTASSPIGVLSAQATANASITTGTGTANTIVWGALRGITWIPVGSSTLAVNPGVDLGLNSGTGLTITAPTTGGGGSGVIGSRIILGM